MNTDQKLTLGFAFLGIMFAFGVNVLQELIRAEQNEYALPFEMESALHEVKGKPDVAGEAIEKALAYPIAGAFDAQLGEEVSPEVVTLLKAARNTEDSRAQLQAVEKVYNIEHPERNWSLEATVQLTSFYWELINVGFGLLAGALVSSLQRPVSNRLSLLWPFLGGICVAGVILAWLLWFRAPSLSPGYSAAPH